MTDEQPANLATVSINFPRFLTYVCQMVWNPVVWKQCPHRYQHFGEAVVVWLAQAGITHTLGDPYVTAFARRWLYVWERRAATPF